LSQASFEIELVNKTRGEMGTNPSPCEVQSPSPV